MPIRETVCAEMGLLHRYPCRAQAWLGAAMKPRLRVKAVVSGSSGGAQSGMLPARLRGHCPGHPTSMHVWGGALHDFHGPFFLRGNFKEGSYWFTLKPLSQQLSRGCSWSYPVPPAQRILNLLGPPLSPHPSGRPVGGVAQPFMPERPERLPDQARVSAQVVHSVSWTRDCRGPSVHPLCVTYIAPCPPPPRKSSPASSC